MGAIGLEEANGSQCNEIKSDYEQEVIEQCDINCKGEIKEARKGWEQRRMKEGVCGLGM